MRALKQSATSCIKHIFFSRKPINKLIKVFSFAVVPLT